MQVVSNPTRFPYSCRGCGASDGAEGRVWWLDFGEDDSPPGDGPPLSTVYFCNLCFAATAHEQGFCNPTEVALLTSANESLESQLFDAKVKADGLENGLNGLLRARFIDVDDASELVSLLEGYGPLADGPPAEGKLVDLGAGTPPEPSHVEGLGDLRSVNLFDDSIGSS